MPSHSAKKKSAPKRSDLPDAESVSYHGPIVSPTANNQVTIASRLFPYQADLTSDASGTVSTVFGGDLSIFQDWSSMAASYKEYRVLGATLQFMPSKKYTSFQTPTNITKNPCFIYIDRTGPTFVGPTVLNGVIQNESVKMVSLEEPWKMTWKMNGIDESGFVNVTSPNPFVAIGVYSIANTISFNMGKCLLKVLVEFRGSG